jgi:phosphatidylglycerophosphate synthase
VSEAYLRAWSALHGDLPPHGLARRWLLLCYPIARRLTGIPPIVLTGCGLVVSAGVPVCAAAGGHWPFLGAVLVVAGGVLDNLDGAVAALTGRASGFGAVVDSVADRISDSAGLLALWYLGAPGWLVGVAAFGTAVQEYVRARAAGLGLPALPLTLWERPTRIILLAGLLIGCGIFTGTAMIATAGAAAALALLLIGFTQLAR